MTSKPVERPPLDPDDDRLAATAPGTRRWPAWTAPACAGTLLIPLVVVLGFRSLASRRQAPPRWPGAPDHPLTAGPGALVAATVAAAALVAAWLWLQRSTGISLRLRTAAGLAAVWGGLLAIAPPLLSNDVYSYAAVGRLATTDLDPYATGPAALGPGPFLAAVDPLWRHTPTPYGPLLVQLFHAAAWLTGGSVLGTVLLLRLMTVVVTAGAVALAVWVARPADRVAVLVVAGLNPVLLLNLVAGTHPDALVGAAVIGVVVLAVSGRWAPAMVLAVLATLVKAPGLALVGFVFLVAVRRTRPGQRVRAGAAATAVAAAVAGVAWLVLPDAFGWVHTLGVPTELTNPRVPSMWAAWLAHTLFGLPHSGTAWHVVSVVSRTVMLLIGAVLALVLLTRAAARTDRWSALRDVGWALVVVAVTGPIVYGWYLAWGLFAAAAGSRPRERWALLLVSAGAFVCTSPAIKPVPVPAQWALWVVAALVWWLAAGRPRPGRRTLPTAAS